MYSTLGKQFGTFIRNLKISVSFDLKFYSWEYGLRKRIINIEKVLRKEMLVTHLEW